MSEYKHNPWSQLDDELGKAFVQSFRGEMATERAKRDANDPIQNTLHRVEHGEVVEWLAAHAHDHQWSGWLTYMFSKGTENADGSLTIPASWYWRWKYQAATPYTELSEAMKESDRAEARAILRLLETKE